MVTALNGSQYKKGYYFGRPKDHTSLTPVTMPFTLPDDNIYSHAYLNVYASGGISFSKVVFIGGGFEMDNVAISELNHTPSPGLVLLQSVLGKSVEFRANGGEGSMAAQTSDTSTSLVPNTFTQSGFTFAGWSTSPTGSVEYLDGATYGFSSDLVLHAVWIANTNTTTTAPANDAVPSTTAATASASVPEEINQESNVKSTRLPTTGTTTAIALLAIALLLLGAIIRLRSHV